ncbi:MAG: hypothetical protein Kow0068_24140 [Marinilabiliales bacterium]
MRKLSTIFVSSIVLCLLILQACKKPVKYPDTPSITHESFEIIDSVDLLGQNMKYGILLFSFIDGDGDIGLNSDDTLPPFDTSSVYYNNLFIKMYEYKNDTLRIVDLETPLNFRIRPRFESTGQNKTLKGKIKVKLEYNIVFLKSYDTIKYEYYILDRAHNQSNTQQSNLIILPDPAN